MKPTVFQPTTMTRRGFVATCALLPIAQACVRMNYLTPDIVGDTLVIARASVDASGHALVEAPSLRAPLYVHHHDGDAYSAVLTRCTHRGCTVEPAVGKLACPCHGSEFSVRGDVLHGPAERPLARVPVRVEGDRLVLRVTALNGEDGEEREGAPR